LATGQPAPDGADAFPAPAAIPSIAHSAPDQADGSAPAAAHGATAPPAPEAQPDASDERVQLPPPLERQEELAAARVAGLASLRAQNPRMGEAALLSYWREGERRSGRLPHDGVRAGSYAPPDFLSGYPVPNGFSFNYNSFMGQMDPLDGKYYVAPQLLSSFLREVHGAMGRRWAKLCLSENYNKRAYRCANPWRRPSRGRARGPKGAARGC
jgi:hypothetical protein